MTFMRVKSMRLYYKTSGTSSSIIEGASILIQDLFDLPGCTFSKIETPDWEFPPHLFPS